MNPFEQNNREKKAGRLLSALDAAFRRTAREIDRQITPEEQASFAANMTTQQWIDLGVFCGCRRPPSLTTQRLVIDRLRARVDEAEIWGGWIQ